MKKLIILAALLATSVINAQTNTPPRSPTDMFNTVFGWFASSNPELEGVFTNTSVMLWAGVDAVQGGNQTLLNEVGLSYGLSKKFPISLEAVTRNGGVAGTVVSQNIGLNLSWNVRDIRFSAYADGGYYLADDEIDWLPFGQKVKFEDRLFGEVGLRVFKAMGKYTYGYVGMGFQFPQTRQVFSAGIGIQF